MEIIIKSGSRREQLKHRYDNLNGYLKKELRGPSPVKGVVYDFNEWSGERTRDKVLGTDRNGSRMKERDEIKKDLER